MSLRKPVSSDLDPARREARYPAPVSAVSAAEALGELPVDEPNDALQAVRYLFLARELRRLGQSEAADRWQAKALQWLARQ